MLVLDRRLAAELSAEEAERIVPRWSSTLLPERWGMGHTQTTICPVPLRMPPIRAQSAW